jgi:hypothetical protein
LQSLEVLLKLKLVAKWHTPASAVAKKLASCDYAIVTPLLKIILRLENVPGREVLKHISDAHAFGRNSSAVAGFLSDIPFGLALHLGRFLE